MIVIIISVSPGRFSCLSFHLSVLRGVGRRRIYGQGERREGESKGRCRRIEKGGWIRLTTIKIWH